MRQLVNATIFSASALLAVMPASAETEVTMKDGLIFKPGLVTMAPIPNDDGAGATSSSIAEPVEFKRSGGHASARECLATAVYFEARGESLKGQKAVAEVIMRRTRQPGRPKTVCGVVYEGSWRSTGCQFSFTCDGFSDVVRDGSAWARARRAASAVLRSGGRGRFSRGATHYHANYVTPYWASSMRRVARIGTHVFYRE
jgi:spore germination cell wall hydrolase CwlJ-like protein